MSRNKFPPKPKYDPDTGPVYLYGIHTVRAALDNPLRERKALLATPNALARLTAAVQRTARAAERARQLGRGGYRCATCGVPIAASRNAPHPG